MHHWLVRFLVVVALGSVAYNLACELALPWSGWLLPARAPSSTLTLYASLHAANAALLIAVSLPFAVLLRASVIGVRWPVRAALLIACLGLVIPAGAQILLPRHIGAAVSVSGAVDLAKFALALPLLTWLVGLRLPSNNSSKPTPLRGAA